MNSTNKNKQASKEHIDKLFKLKNKNSDIEGLIKDYHKAIKDVPRTHIILEQITRSRLVIQKRDALSLLKATVGMLENTLEEQQKQMADIVNLLNKTL